MAIRIPWSHDELLVAFRIYCRMPFGKLHQNNSEILKLARLLGRTPSAVAMKACNFASLDPVHQTRGISGLRNVSRADCKLWEEFYLNAEKIANEAEVAFDKLKVGEQELMEQKLVLPDGPTERNSVVRTRRIQNFFRNAIMASYEYRCALSDISLPELLNASHIIPWSVDVTKRADPRNGILLNALYDRAFDRGLITFDESMCVIVSPKVRSDNPPLLQRQTLLSIEGKPLRQPQRFAPSYSALTYHRENIFQD